LFTGKDLIRMGYKPGPLFAEILTSIEDAQLEGAIGCKDEAEDLVITRWPRT
ncbi:MAG: CCA tRNA nucleotidyltransferase, partial [bacterium]|nr:CCA tRNA nucleotidyltransferase [bacterium]